MGRKRSSLTSPCLDCGVPVPPSHARRGEERLRAAVRDVPRGAMPRCPKCLSKWLWAGAGGLALPRRTGKRGLPLRRAGGTDMAAELFAQSGMRAAIYPVKVYDICNAKLNNGTAEYFRFRCDYCNEKSPSEVSWLDLGGLPPTSPLWFGPA